MNEQAPNPNDLDSYLTDIADPAPEASNTTKKIPIVETFGPTIQGEGLVIGYQTFFIRFGGCDYKCERCDSLHAVLPNLIKQNSIYMTMDQLIYHTRLMHQTAKAPYMWTFSGGNPCLWDLTLLVKDIYQRVPTEPIAVETQGTIWQNWLYDCSFVTVSPKGPGMGEAFNPETFGIFCKRLHDHPGFSVKVVVFDQRDIEFVVEILARWPGLRHRMFISIGNTHPPAPAKRDHEEISRDGFIKQVLHSTRQIAEEILQDPRLYGVRILPQLHTLLWGNERGR